MVFVVTVHALITAVLVCCFWGLLHRDKARHKIEHGCSFYLFRLFVLGLK
jgi:hypothetical protein